MFENLASARLAGSYFLAGAAADAYQRRLARDLAPSLWLATALSQALVRDLPQAAIMGAVRRLPLLMTFVARATRLPDSSLRRAGLAIV